MILILLPIGVKAYSTNMTGNVIESSTGGSSASSHCGYYIGFAGESYMFYGLRITYYNLEGQQIGNTVDVWVWKDLFARNWGKQLGNKLGSDSTTGFTKYQVNSRYGDGLLSKVDYRKGSPFRRTQKTTYTFYYDDYARESAGSREKNNPLFYTTQANRTKLKEYLTTEEVMVRYLKLANAYSYVNVKAGDYLMVLEPIISLSATDECQKNEAYTGRYTVTEVGYMLNEVKSISKDALLHKLPQYLQLENGMAIANMYFSAGDNADRYYTKEEMTSSAGIGIGTIQGTEVCKQNCEPITPQTYKVVYRTIDLINPFLNKNGTIRVLSTDSNWYNKQSTIDADIYMKKPFLTVVLTPTTIKEMRNDKINYNDITDATYQQFKIKYRSIFQ